MSAVGFVEYGWPRRQFDSLARNRAILWDASNTERRDVVLVGDLGPDDHAVVLASSRALTAHRIGVRCMVSLLLLEPPAVQRRIYRLMPVVAPLFHRVMTHHRPLAERIGNACIVTHGGSWLTAEVDPLTPRVAHMSLVASNKRQTEGQRLRHRLAEWSREAGVDVRLLGRGYQPFEERSQGFLPFRFSVVVENSREAGYFTEKIVDCLLCGTVPIYWGDPEIGRHFDLDGIILCRDEGELRAAILNATRERLTDRLYARQRNAALAFDYRDHRPKIARILREGYPHRG
jgi:hypothetical protein